MKKKYLGLVLATGLLLSSLTGCGTKADITVKSDGTANVSLTNYLSQKEVDALGGDPSDLKSEVIDGVTYYHDEPQEDVTSWEDLKTSNTAVVTKNYVAASIKNANNTDGFVDFTIKLPYKVAKTNCTKVADDTIHFDLSNLSHNTAAYQVVYATKNASYTKGKKIDISGVTNKKWYNSCFKKIKITSKDGIINSIRVKADKDLYDFPVTMNEFNLSDQRFSNATHYTITATTIGGGKKSVSFSVDDSNPNIGVFSAASGKTEIVAFDYESGVKAIYLDGKNITKKCKVSKDHSQYTYTVKLSNKEHTVKVTDKANNVHETRISR